MRFARSSSRGPTRFVAAAALAPLFGCSVLGSHDPPDLLLITVDTLRADRLGCYGAPGDPTPNIDALAREAVLFEAASTTIPRTTQAFASLFTGRHPIEHGVLEIGEYLTLDALTLAEQLRAAGYATAGISSNLLAGSFQGMHQGFERFIDATDLQQHHEEAGGEGPFHAETVTASGLDCLMGLDSDRPRFLWVHYTDPHFPYDPPLKSEANTDADVLSGRAFYRELRDFEPRSATIQFDLNGRSSALRDTLSRLYDREIRHTDEMIGPLLDAWVEATEGGSSLVAFTADHGESLGEHGYFYEHGDFVYEPSSRIPLLLRLPDGVRGGGRVETPVSIVDVAPTLLQLLGLDPLPDASGADLRGLLRGDEGAASRGPVFIESGSALHPQNPQRSFAGRRRPEGPGQSSFISAREENWVLVREREGESPRLYDATNDPAFSVDLAAEHPERVRRLA
ncbi:MAG: hypothetical protein CME06_18410, partial [Gemmatimonadetes bacterium]|nr:hypothetical protein [Gemmatimonadota bacterium]